MKRLVAVCICALIALTPAAGVLRAVKAANPQVLRIYSWEDYIAGDDDGNKLYNGFETEDDDGNKIIYDGFAKWYKENYDANAEVKIEYSTFGTNEIMYNELKINKGSYDLVCPSDYMIEKMIAEDMLEPLDKSKLTNYYSNVSGYINGLFEHYGYTDDSNVLKPWADYAAGYMWGTMGYVYNPEFVSRTDVKSWSALWNIDYKNKSTLKNSVRDTYFLGLGYVYRDELNQLAADLEDENITLEEYQQTLAVIFNRTDDESIKKVGIALSNVSKNIFSFELDEGKNDMVTGKILINFAWSGDAVYAIDQAEESGVELYYSVPEEGSNVWFDGWVMPKGANTELASAFINYLSIPKNAIANMDYIGYTSVIAGDEVFDWATGTYGAQEGAEKTYDVDLSYFFNDLSGARTGVITTDTLGRRFSAQYPDSGVINRSTVMQRFSNERMEKINSMWENVKSRALPVWAIILIVAGALVVVGGAVLIIFIKKRGYSKPRKNLTIVKKG